MALENFVNGTMLNKFAKLLKSNIKSDLLGDKKLRYLTQAEYDLLTDDEKNDENIIYNITDADVDDNNHIKFLTDAYGTASAWKADINSMEAGFDYKFPPNATKTVAISYRYTNSISGGVSTTNLVVFTNNSGKIPVIHMSEKVVDSKYVIMIGHEMKVKLDVVDNGDGTKTVTVTKTPLTLSVSNTLEYAPTEDYNPATKKYVDDIAANKVDVVEGKALVNTGEIARLSKVNNYNDAEVRGLIEDLSESKADATSIPTKVSQLTNDSGFLTAVPAMYATQAYVADAINKAQLDGSDSEIDLSPYALTSDLALKADKTELHTHENQTLLNSITKEHLASMAEISDTLNGPRNYYNAEAITDGVYLNSSGGLYENPVYFTTDYIPIAPGQTLYFYGANGRYDVQTNVRFVGFYDTGKNFIAGSIMSNVNKATNTYENGA